MIILKITCCMCGNEFPNEIEADKKKQLTVKHIKTTLEKSRWIVEVNGEHIDTYCCKYCAA